MKKKRFSFKEFYNLIKKSKKIRKKIFLEKIKGKTSEKNINKLKKLFLKIKAIPKEKNNYILYDNQEKIQTKLIYEINELERDILFLEKGTDFLFNKLRKQNKNFDSEVKKVLKYLKNKKIDTFVSDRDGTFVNFSERYSTSVQSVYSAFFVYSFISKIPVKIILTSGPLQKVLDLSLIPENFIAYGCSKGREFFYNNKIYKIPVSRNQEITLRKIKKEIKKLKSIPKYKKFFLKGSGFMEKYGEISISRQDCLDSIPKKESRDFLDKITSIVEKIDNENLIEIKDLCLDIELISKKQDKNFNKGDGIEFILKTLKINPEISLFCGDTISDIPALEKLEKSSKKTRCIFVTKNKELKKQVKQINPDSIFVSSPDVLVSGFYLSFLKK